MIGMREWFAVKLCLGSWNRSTTLQNVHTYNTFMTLDGAGYCLLLHHIRHTPHLFHWSGQKISSANLFSLFPDYMKRAHDACSWTKHDSLSSPNPGCCRIDSIHHICNWLVGPGHVMIMHNQIAGSRTQVHHVWLCTNIRNRNTQPFLLHTLPFLNIFELILGSLCGHCLLQAL